MAALGPSTLLTIYLEADVRAWIGDLKASIRQLSQAPGFTVAAVAVLAIGIGLNAAMFSVVYALAFMGRAFHEPERVVQLYSSESARVDSFRSFSYPAFRELASRRDLFDGVLAHNPTIVGVTENNGDARRTFAVLVSRNYFEVLGVPIVRGRGFTDEEDQPGRDVPVVIATHSYWQRTGFDPDLIGKTARINDRAYTVIGITPRGFSGTMTVFGPELFFPLGVFHTLANDFQGEAARSLERADTYNLFLAARLKPGLTIEGAATQLVPAGQQLERAFPVEYKDARVTLAALPRFGTSTSPRDESVIALLGAVMLGLTGAVLLTVCLNLAAMLLARGRARRKEFAIRLALGAGRLRIVRQLLTEGLLLALAGGTLGVALGLASINALVGAFAAMLPITIVLEGAVSPALIAATIVFCLLATVWFALGPALRSSRADVLADLKPQAGEDVSERRGRFLPRNPLVVAQVALSLALLIAAGLFVRMARGAIAVDEFGYHADRTVLVEVDSSLAGYSTAQTISLYDRVEQRLAGLPGVQSASVGALVPLGMVSMSRSVRRAGLVVPPDARPTTPEQGRAFNSPWNAVSGSYFIAMGIALRQGRTFTDLESFHQGTPAVAILDEALAAKLWPDGTALGRRIQFRPETDNGPVQEMDVVGIVSATHRDLFEKEMPGLVYVPFAQGAKGNAYFHVRPAAGAGDLIDTIRREIRDAAPGVPLFSAQTFETHVNSSAEYWSLRVASAIFGSFGVLAMLVALVGIYGVMSYAVSRRTREIGIRMAVGAVPQAVRGMVMRESLSMTLMGVAAGWLLGIGVGRVMGNLFVDVSPFDPLTFTVVPVVFVLSALVAAWIPARRATRVNPMVALRSE